MDASIFDNEDDNHWLHGIDTLLCFENGFNCSISIDVLVNGEYNEISLSIDYNYNTNGD